jgi:hypothetical protein
VEENAGGLRVEWAFRRNTLVPNRDHRYVEVDLAGAIQEIDARFQTNATGCGAKKQAALRRIAGMRIRIASPDHTDAWALGI